MGGGFPSWYIPQSLLETSSWAHVEPCECSQDCRMQHWALRGHGSSTASWDRICSDSGCWHGEKVFTPELLREMMELSGEMEEDDPNCPWIGTPAQIMKEQKKWGLNETTPDSGLPKSCHHRILTPWWSSPCVSTQLGIPCKDQGNLAGLYSLQQSGHRQILKTSCGTPGWLSR